MFFIAFRPSGSVSSLLRCFLTYWDCYPHRRCCRSVLIISLPASDSWMLENTCCCLRLLSQFLEVRRSRDIFAQTSSGFKMKSSFCTPEVTAFPGGGYFIRMNFPMLRAPLLPCSDWK